MRVIVVGMGIQGRKRKAIAGAEVVACVDPVVDGVEYRRIEDVPLDDYDAALLCIPDEPKVTMITYLLENKKHVLVEKPLMSESQQDLDDLAALARRQGTVCYTAYNHRFEPHFMKLAETVKSGVLGKIYRVRMFYGNGTARDVRNSVWRDTGAGVLPDLGSHLLDTLLYCFGGWPEDLKVWSAQCFENKAFDHVICGGTKGLHVELEMSLMSWRNHFVCEVVGEAGSVLIESLCKWGPSTFSLRKRVLPSGRPPEESITLVQPDPTWEIEYAHFKSLIAQGSVGNIDNDVRINRTLTALMAQALAEKTQ